MPPNPNVVLRQNETLQPVLHGGQRGQQAVSFYLAGRGGGCFPYTNLGVLVRGEELGVVEGDGLDGAGRWIVVEGVDVGVVR